MDDRGAFISGSANGLKGGRCNVRSGEARRGQEEDEEEEEEEEREKWKNIQRMKIKLKLCVCWGKVR